VKDDVARALRDQEEIGWTNLLEGCVAKAWEEIQQRYYCEIGSKWTGRRWVTELIKKLWAVAWDMWEQQNGALYKAECNEVNQNIRLVDEEIRQLFRRGAEGLPARVHYLFAGHVDDLLQTSAQHRQKWLQTVKGARGISRAMKEREVNEMESSRRIMRKWLAGGS
jgi:hypothetical protein